MLDLVTFQESDLNSYSDKSIKCKNMFEITVCDFVIEYTLQNRAF